MAVAWLWLEVVSSLLIAISKLDHFYHTGGFAVTITMTVAFLQHSSARHFFHVADGIAESIPLGTKN
jgi:hypothetical protein